MLTFNLNQKHGGWDSDDNQNNNLGRFRLSVTTSAGRRRPIRCRRSVREILAIPREQRTPAQDAGRLQLLAHDRPRMDARPTTRSKSCGSSTRRAPRNWSLRARETAARDPHAGARRLPQAGASR